MNRILSNIYIKSSLLATIGILFFASCQEKDQFTPDPVMGEVSAFYEAVSDDPITTSFNIDEGFTLITPHITSLHIPSSSLVRSDGTVVTGQVEVSLQDVKGKGEMMIQKISTMFDNSLLTSEAAVYVDFSQNGESLSIRPGSLITLRVKDNTPISGMSLYDGVGVASPVWVASTQSMNQTNWSFFWDGKEYLGNGYELNINKTGWFSISKKIVQNTSGVNTICGEVPQELFNDANSDIFMMIDDTDTVVPLQMDSENLLFCASFDNFNAGSSATFVAVASLEDGNFHFGTTHATISTDGKAVVIVPEPKTKEEILDLLGMF